MEYVKFPNFYSRSRSRGYAMKTTACRSTYRRHGAGFLRGSSIRLFRGFVVDRRRLTLTLPRSLRCVQSVHTADVAGASRAAGGHRVTATHDDVDGRVGG